MAMMLFEGGEEMLVKANYEDIERGERLSLESNRQMEVRIRLRVVVLKAFAVHLLVCLCVVAF
jgi:hypothetical protein